MSSHASLYMLCRMKIVASYWSPIESLPHLPKQINLKRVMAGLENTVNTWLDKANKLENLYCCSVSGSLPIVVEAHVHFVLQFGIAFVWTFWCFDPTFVHRGDAFEINIHIGIYHGINCSFDNQFKTELHHEMKYHIIQIWQTVETNRNGTKQ